MLADFFDGKKEIGASTGPRFMKRGNSADQSSPGFGLTSFNGAALHEARK